MYTELRTDDGQELIRFMENHVATLDQSRIEITKTKRGEFVAELLSNEPEPEPA
jgi:hypothetical protein